ncbi:MAG: hypothetical protein J6I76_16565 [Oribacterium sp.]|nr:hypothetical protein [Oribacterium sp.]
MLVLSAALVSASVTFSSFAGSSFGDYISQIYGSVAENTANARTDWAREVADTPVVSVYKGTPENNVEGQFDMAGAIKAFEYAQAHRFPTNEGRALKAYEWDDTLAGFAQKMLKDDVALGAVDKGYVFDDTGRFDQTRVYNFATYFLGTTGYPYDINCSNTYRGKTVDEAILGFGNLDGLRNPLAQNDYAKKVGAAVLNHNGEKLLLFVMSEEGKAYTWQYFGDHGGVDNYINECSLPYSAFREMYAN